jgi:hypothetical protein
VEAVRTDAYGIRHPRLASIADPTERKTLAAEVPANPARFEEVSARLAGASSLAFSEPTAAPWSLPRVSSTSGAAAGPIIASRRVPWRRQSLRAAAPSSDVTSHVLVHAAHTPPGATEPRLAAPCACDGSEAEGCRLFSDNFSPAFYAAVNS